MVRVTDLNYPMEDKLKEKLDMMIARMTGESKRDNVLLIDGDEGDGKTTMEAGIAYYVHYVTKRPLSLKNLFFNLDELINFAINTKEQIICWDEGALGGLAGDWWNKNQKKFLKLLMVARKRRHFFIICIPKFFKLNEYLVLDRSIGLVHVYSRGQITQGRFVYFSKQQKEKLYYDWRKSRYRNYKKYYGFHGSFPNIFNKVFNEDEYDKRKDDAIMSIDKEEEKEVDEKDVRRKLVLDMLNNLEKLKGRVTNDDIATLLGVGRSTFYSYKEKISQISKSPLVQASANNNNLGTKVPKCTTLQEENLITKVPKCTDEQEDLLDNTPYKSYYQP